MTALANAQATYEVIDLGVLDPSNPEGEAFSLNSDVQVVGWSRAASGELHAIFWQYCELVTLPGIGGGSQARVLIDLTQVTGLAASTHSKAYDINEHMVIVGEEFDGSTTDPRAYLWDLGGLAPTSLPISGTGSMYSTAYALDDSIPPRIVGEEHTGNCTFNPSEPDRDGIYAIGATFNASLPPGVAGTPREEAIGYDINNLASPTIAGTVKDLCGSPDLSKCDGLRRAAVWPTPGNAPVTLDELIPGDGAAVRGVNDQASAVGLSWDKNDLGCFQRASYWSSAQPGVTPEDLHQYIYNVALAEDSVAYGINEPSSYGNTYAVGESPSAGRGLWWCQDASLAWDGAELNDLVASGSGWTIVRAWDVNDRGWVVGVGEFNNGAPRAVLLRPIGCLGDANGDGEIDGSDVTQVLGSWNGCDPYADFDGDGTISGGDMTFVLANWGLICRCNALFDPAAPEGQGERAGDLEVLDESTVLEALALVGFSGIDAFQAWSREASEPERLHMGHTIHALLEAIR